MAKLEMFFKTLGTKIATLWKTTTWFKIASIGGAVVIATSAIVIPNAVISETGGIFHKCDFSIENIDTTYSHSVATCTEKAKYYYSCACGERGTELFEYGNVLGHDLTHHDGKQVTCTDIGYDEYDTCSRCDYSTYEEISATGHKDGEWIIDAEATCTEDGSKHQVCSVCDATIKTESLTKLGHTDGQWITDKEANCTEDGSKHQVCSVCEATIKTTVIPAIGHTDGNWITDTSATCTENGSKHQICSVCNDTIKTAAIPAAGHDDGEWITDKEPNCTEDGIKHQICSICKVTLKTESAGKAYGHTYTEEYVSDTSPYILHSCKNCDNEYKVNVKPITADISKAIGTMIVNGTTYNICFEVSNVKGGYGNLTVTASMGTVMTGWDYDYDFDSMQMISKKVTNIYLRSSSLTSSFIDITISDNYGTTVTYRVRISDGAILQVKIGANPYRKMHPQL